jgi:hypothetical protein
MCQRNHLRPLAFDLTRNTNRFRGNFRPFIASGRRSLLVDALDGTKEFIQGRNEFTVNIGLIEQEMPVAGAVLRLRLAFYTWLETAHIGWRPHPAKSLRPCGTSGG